MILHSPIPAAHPCDLRDCGRRWCNDCGERLTCAGPEPAVRCSEHDTCTDCVGPVYCMECCQVVAEAAQDYADDRACDVARDA